MAAKRIPNGFRTITPHLVCRNAKKAIEFYQQAFGAENVRTHLTPDGSVMHAELKIGDSLVMLGEEYPAWNVLSPQTIGNTSVFIHIYTDDVDSLYQRAVSAGCTATMPVMDQFWATDTVRLWTRMVIDGRLQRTWKMFPKKKWKNVDALQWRK